MIRVFCLSVLLSLVTSTVQSRVERFAVVVGNNRGSADETPLRYAETDARRVYDVLHQLGDFSPLNMLLLRGQDASTVRGGLLAINERIRDALSTPDTQAVLVVYYSGHADAEALHLRGTELPFSELRQIARGSSANFRLVVLDACRSGSFTRVKGARRVAAFAIPPLADEPLPGNGLAFLTATSANEDAQESDELQGSFFTHAFVSGLLGAADRDGDGAVVLDEAYRYAYESTLRATSRTFAGTQHPTFNYDLRGRGQVVLTRPRAYASERAAIDFPPGIGYLLLRDHPDGTVVIELDRSEQRRSLSLEAGRYFVRARAPDVIYEGYVDAAAGTSRVVDVGQFDRIEYARLVRKGARSTNLAHGPEAGVSLRSALPNADSVCIGAFVGYALDFESFGVRARLALCVSDLKNELVRATVMDHDLTLDFYHAWDISLATVAVGVGGGLSLFRQSFETRGSAPDRWAAAPFIDLATSAQLELGLGFYTALQLGAETHFLSIVDHARQSDELNVAFAVRSSMAFGKRF